MFQNCGTLCKHIGACFDSHIVVSYVSLTNGWPQNFVMQASLKSAKLLRCFHLVPVACSTCAGIHPTSSSSLFTGYTWQSCQSSASEHTAVTLNLTQGCEVQTAACISKHEPKVHKLCMHLIKGYCSEQMAGCQK